MDKIYKIGYEYRDKGKLVSDDEFLMWLNGNKGGINNNSGIRGSRYFENKFNKWIEQEYGSILPAYVVLIITEKKTNSYNPWVNTVNYTTANIRYWGDAKKDKSKGILDFPGNKILHNIDNYIHTAKVKKLIPPILSFSKPKGGIVRFNGLCILKELNQEKFTDEGTPINNYRCTLEILDVDEVDVEWLDKRRNSKNEKELEEADKYAPIVWRDYVKKSKVKKLNVYVNDIRSTLEQLPNSKPDIKILDQILKLNPFQFEKFVVKLFKEVKDVTHKIEGTRKIKDGGFDFYGQFYIKEPIGYRVNFLGEAKRYCSTQGVKPKDVCRLVARLKRGEYGIFITTSYYTKATQQEVLEDEYPIKLFSGLDIINFLKDLNLVEKDKINEIWFDDIIHDT